MQNASEPLVATTVTGTGSYVPDTCVSSTEMEARLGLHDGWIFERTGVLERRVASPTQATSDLATIAATHALTSAGVSATDIGLIIVGTSTPDSPLPSTACIVQAQLGAAAAVAMDIDAVCTGFVYALDVARKMMQGDPELDHALVIGADVYSRILDYTDRRTSVLFGDGAGAVVLSRSNAGAAISHSKLGSDGTLSDYVGIVGGGSRRPLTPDRLSDGEQFFRMNGRAVRDFVHDRLPQMIHEALDARGLVAADIDLFVPHQANVRILEEVSKHLGFAHDQLAITADRFGNTGAASIPITLDYVVRQGGLEQWRQSPARRIRRRHDMGLDPARMAGIPSSRTVDHGR
ncbi:ketoacyl-ACP synthase III [Rhodococcus sp. H29-C3]|uniref:3-oxoacyl-ACP synthase III family protein n=1 Tax=Rhodococcus sp. H29-C3 TaxID=3046307 RepID=UPI0024BA117B|nr:ketoacyl-ACP synthase III [Rhodococcus sp. H29-C3]MDJ0362549.1 ketoacyl-ACP synthase III [Rhodococcus sp. H29-C3]